MSRWINFICQSGHKQGCSVGARREGAVSPDHNITLCKAPKLTALGRSQCGAGGPGQIGPHQATNDTVVLRVSKKR